MAGLGYVDFCNVRFKSDKIGGLKVPHMGWDYVKIIDKNNSLVKEVEGEQRYYFVHSYHAVCNEGNNILMECEYGYPFVAAINRDNIYGVQFHPEKSHKFGMKLLKNFVEEC